MATKDKNAEYVENSGSRLQKIISKLFGVRLVSFPEFMTSVRERIVGSLKKGKRVDIPRTNAENSHISDTETKTSPLPSSPVSDENNTKEVSVNNQKEDQERVLDVEAQGKRTSVTLDDIKRDPWLIREFSKPSKEMCCVAIEQDPWTIQFIDKPSNDLALKAVIRNPRTIQHIKNPSNKVASLAVWTNWENIKLIADPSNGVCREALRQNPLALQYIKKQTPLLCKMAIKSNWEALQFVANQTEDLVDMAVNINPWAIQYAKHPSSTLCEKAVSKNGLTIEAVNKKMLTEAIGYKAVKNNPQAFRFIPAEVRSERIWKESLSKDGILIRYIDDPTDVMVKAALRQNPKALQYVKNQTPEQCQFAMSLDPSVSKFVKIHVAKDVGKSPSLKKIEKKLSTDQRIINPPHIGITV